MDAIVAQHDARVLATALPLDGGEGIARTVHPFLVPDRPYETAGQVNQVVFVEGLVPFRGRWHLYYGTADSRIAVATAPL